MESAVGFLLSPTALFTLRFSLSSPMAPIDIGKHAGILAVNIEEQMIEALPRWRAFALSRVASVDDADDLVQRAIVRIIERHKASPFEPDTNIEAFGITVIRNLMIDDARSRQTQKTDNVGDVEDVGGASASNPETLTLVEELKINFKRLCLKLSKACQKILKLYAEGFKYAEMAEELGINTNTVGTRLLRCRNKLKDLMESDSLYDWDDPNILDILGELE
mgnify:CR=1 FL=1